MKHWLGSILLATTLVPGNTLAATLVVTVTDDTSDGTCGAHCSLREAVAAASDGDVIAFSSAFEAPRVIALEGTALAIGKSIAIAGPGPALLTIEQRANDWLLWTAPGAHEVIVSGVTLHNPRSAALVHSNGRLMLDRAVITGAFCFYNTAEAIVNASTVRGCAGGGIQNLAQLTLTNSTVTNNSGYGSVDLPLGAGIYHTGTALMVDGSTISGNDSSFAGGIYARGPVVIRNSTIVNNSGLQTGGVYAESTVSITNSIIANRFSTPDVVPAGSLAILESGGFNFVGRDVTDGFRFAGDRSGSLTAPLDPTLGPLRDNGGPTATHLPASGSPVIDTGHAQGALVDQRGQARRYDYRSVQDGAGGDRSDTGAVEARPFVSIRGRVTDPRGAAIPDVRVIVDRVDGGTLREQRAGLLGRFVVAGLPSGARFVVRAAIDGYRFVPQVVEGEADVDGVVILGVPDVP